MSYEYYAMTRSPVSLWPLDDTIPFRECTGFNASGTSSAAPAKSVPLVSGAANSSIFKTGAVGKFACNLFKQGLEDKPFALESWVLPVPKTTTGDQQILSHLGYYDGLSINGKIVRFGTEYQNSGGAYCSFDLQEYQSAHVVGIHNSDSNQLYVNSQLVASVRLTDEQKADTYIPTDDYLYAGNTGSSQQIAMNGVAFYPSLSSESIVRNYLAGLDALPQARVTPQYDGLAFNLNAAHGSKYLEQHWLNINDFQGGLKNNVEYAPEQVGPTYVDGLSIAGSWTCAAPLDTQGDTSIYGAMVSWSGQNITVDVSLDGTTWTTAKSGELVSIVPNGFDPTGKDLQVRISFAAGYAQDTSYLDSVSVIAWRNNQYGESVRSVSASYPSVLRDDYEPILYRDDNGVSLHGGTLTIGPDTTGDPWIARTVEIWIKPLSGTPTINIGATKFRNGVADSTLPVGEWSLLHYVAGADIVGNITITGDCIVGQVVLYPTAFTAADADFVLKSYTGRPVVRINDPSVIQVSEPAAPVAIYAHDWSISSAG